MPKWDTFKDRDKNEMCESHIHCVMEVVNIQEEEGVDLLSSEPSEQYCIFFVLSSIFQRSWKQFSFIHVDKDPAEVVDLGAKEEEEVTDEVVYDKKKAVKLVDE